jgi:hypothetical protein
MEIAVDRNLSPDGVFAEPGDSGSVVLKRDEPVAVGLLWSGSTSWGAMTDIQFVQDELEISMVLT